MPCHLVSLETRPFVQQLVQASNDSPLSWASIAKGVPLSWHILDLMDIQSQWSDVNSYANSNICLLSQQLRYGAT